MMIDASGLQLPPPTDWPAFERLMRRLFAKILDCPHTYLVGRNGQNQSGIDIVARRKDGSYVGIQCKLKDELANTTELRRIALRKEIDDAQSNFKPKLSEFILATTASNEADLQEYARELTDENGSGGPSVYIYGWHHLRTLIGEDAELREDYLGKSGVAEIGDKIDRNQVEVRDALASIRAALPITTPDLDVANPQLTRAINRIKAKLKAGHVRAALVDLEALRQDEWEDASIENRFLILTNMGAAYWQLAEYDMATPFFIEASALQPDHEKGLANLAVVKSQGGDPAGARDVARRLLALNPATEAGLLALLQAQEALDPLPDPLDALPEDRRECEEALIGAIQISRLREDGRWLGMVDDALQRYPDSDLLARMKAESVLHRLAVVDGAHVGARSRDAPSRAEVGDAVRTLETIWQRHLACEPSFVDTSLAQNLAQLYRAVGREGDGLAVLERADGSPGDDERTVHLHALLLMVADRRQDAIDTLKQRLDLVANRLLACQLLEDRPEEARQMAAEGDWSTATPDQLMWRGVLDAESHAKLDPEFDPCEELNALADQHSDRLIPLIAMAKQLVVEEEMATIADRLLARANDRTPFSDILQAALWLRESHHPGHVVSLLRDRITLDQDTPALRWLIEALFAVDDREGLVAIFDLLPAEVADMPRFLHYQAVSYFNLGDMKRARLANEKLIVAAPDDLKTRLLWVQILLRQNDRKSIETWLETPVEEFSGSPKDLADIGHLLASFGHFDRARAHGYRTARRFPESKAAQEKFVAIFFQNVSGAGANLSASRIGPDTVFTLVDESGQKRDYRLENETDLPRDAIDLAPDARIALAATGLAVGESFELPSTMLGGPTQHHTVESIVHKYIHYWRLLLDTLPDRFPGPAMFHKVMIDPETGKGLEVLHDTLRLTSEQIDGTLERYLDKALPLRAFAAANGIDIIDAYDGMRERDAARFICSAGAGAEFNRERRAIAHNQGNGCIVDALTLEIVRRLELLELVEKIIGGLGVTQATIDLFIYRSQNPMAAGEYQGSLMHKDGHTVRIPAYPALNEAIANVRTVSRDWAIANTSIVPSIGAPGYARKLRDIIPATLNEHFCDDLLAVSQTGLLLLSDDLGYRRIAHAAGIERSAGLLALLRVALDAGVIDRRFFVEKVAAVAHARHSFIPLGKDDLLEALKIDSASVGSTLRGLAMLLGGKGVRLETHVAVACAFLDAVWSRSELYDLRLELIMLIADRLFEGFPAQRRAFSAKLFSDPDAGVHILRDTANACAKAATQAEAVAA